MNFLFISEHLPLDTYASEVIFYRHFIKLIEDGHSIHLLTDQNSYNNKKKNLDSRFFVHILPNRKWYYPPFKPYGILQKIRFFFYYYFYTKTIIKKYNIDKLIGYIHGNFLTAFTAYIQNKCELPLISFFHDDTNELNFENNNSSINNNTTKILEASTKVLIASEAFKDNWPNYSNKFVLLFPIPEAVKITDIKTIDLNNKSIGYSGSVYNEIIPSLDKFSSFLRELNFGFTIIGNNKNVLYLAKKYKEVSCLPLFDKAEEASNYLIDNCQACIIAYPEHINEMPWIKTCFPSKFIQYCILDIPTIIIAPTGSALGKWCIKNKWELYSNNYDLVKIKNMLSKILVDKEVKNHIKLLKENDFNSEKIHKLFKDIVFY